MSRQEINDTVFFVGLTLLIFVIATLIMSAMPINVDASEYEYIPTEQSAAVGMLILHRISLIVYHLDRQSIPTLPSAHRAKGDLDGQDRTR